MKTCNQCGAELEHDQAKFCSSCGADVTIQVDDAPEKVVVKDDDAGKVATENGTGAERDITEPKNNMADDKEPSPQVETENGREDAEGPGEGDFHNEQDMPGDKGESSEEHADKYKEAVEDAWDDGVFDEKDRRDLDDVRQELSLSDSKAADLEQDARKSMSTEGRDHSDPDLSVVDIEINDSRFYMEKRMAVLEFEFVNKSDRRMSRVKLSINSRQFEDKTKSCTVSLKPGQRRRHKLEVLPSVAGEHLTNLTLSYKFDGVQRAYTAQQTFQVLDENLTPQNLTLNIDQSLKAGGDIGYGNSVRNQVKEDIHKGLVKTVNDLITRKYEPNWQKITLYPDESVLASSRPVRVVRGRLKHDDVDVDRACLSADGLNTAFISAGEIKMGRNRRENDINLRVLPRNEKNDQDTLKISRTHIILRLDKDGLKLADNNTTWGTTVNGKKIDGEVQLSLRRPSEVEVAGALPLTITPLLVEKSGDLRLYRYKELGKPGPLWKLAGKHNLRAVRIERKGNLAERECYVVVYRWMNIGCRAGRGVLMPEEGVPVFRLLRYGDRFWLESMSDSAEINDVPVEPSEAAPLSTYTVIRAGSGEAEFSIFCQCS